MGVDDLVIYVLTCVLTVVKKSYSVCTMMQAYTLSVVPRSAAAAPFRGGGCG